MKSLVFLLLASFGLVLIAEDATDGCEEDWTKRGDSCYLRVMSRTSWEKAEQMCEEKGGSLVTVNDQAEMEFLKELLGKSGSWNGLNNRADIDALVWSSGESSEYQYWGTNEPKKNKRRRCVHMQRLKDYRWRMVRCSAKYRFICEKALEVHGLEPVALFPLNGAYGTKEINGRQPEGIPNDVKLAPGPDGKQNGSYEFYGKDTSYIEFPNDGGLDMKHSFTLLHWFQPFEVDYSEPMITYYNRDNGNLGVSIELDYENLIAWLTDSDYLTASNTLDLVSMTWYYVGVSYDYDTGNACLFLDGVVVATGQLSKNTSFATQQYPLIAGGLSKLYIPFEGRIAWIQLYDVALSDEQVKAVGHFTGESAALEVHGLEPVALFPLNGAYGTKEINGRQPEGIPNDVKLAPGPDGKQNGSYEFYGKDTSYIEFPNDGGLDMKHSFTLLHWFQPFEVDYSEPMITYYNRDNGNLGVSIELDYENLIAWLTDSDYLTASNTLDLVSMTWYYVGVSYNYDTGNASLYLDGVVVATGQFSKNTSFATQQYPLIAGGLSKLYIPFEGRIAWIQLYDVALSDEQVKAVGHFTGESAVTE